MKQPTSAVMNLTLEVWRQAGPHVPGSFVNYKVERVSPEWSFLEMLDYLNETLIKKALEPIAFDSDCREGICGSCGFMINGQAHGPLMGTACCQLHMRSFKDGDVITLEPWRSKAFPVIRDLLASRSALDRIIGRGGYVSTKTGPHADANAILVPKPAADQAMDMAACIGCGACVAACPNGSVALFTAARISMFGHLPQGEPERKTRVRQMVEQMDLEGFGNCSNIGECRAACPKEISIESIALMRRDYLRSMVS